jgi:N-acetylmuramoyl-L-alanine amidase
MIQLVYLIKSVFISGLLFAYFWIFLRNRFFHSFNRLFLICIPLFSFLLPALHFGLPEFWNRSASASPIHLLGVAQGGLEEAVTIYAKRNSGHSLSWEWIALLITLFISTILFVRFLKTIHYLRNLRRNRTFLQLPEATVFFVSEKGTPFSFFKSIFWGEEMEMNNREGRQILRHELFHVTNHHSVDIIGMEIISILCWFNPVFHLISRELKLIHEYAADACVVAETNEYEYAGLLLTKISGRPLPLTNPFFKNQIKRRIAMITKTDKNKKAITGRLMILPLFVLLICLFSFKIKTILPFHSAKTIKVVIDAGHGGSFTGAQVNGIYEKDINLIISRKIQSLAKEYNVDVIMTRETDITPGGKELRESLEYIAALPKNKNADLFISIHANMTPIGVKGKTQTSSSGFQIWIPGNTSNVYDGSVKLGSVLTEVIKSDYIIEPKLKQPPGDDGNILILRKATVPAVIIECGYMDNPADMKYLQDEKNQEKIARDILKGIRAYGSNATSYAHPDLVPDNSQDYKIISQRDAQALPGTVQSFDFDYKRYLVLMNMKDGQKFAFEMSDEEKKWVDDPKELEKYKEKHANDLREIKSALDSMNHANLNNQPVVFTQVETTAEFPGGQMAWRDYLIKNLSYPPAAQKKEIQGEVIVAFIVKKDGNLSDIHAISGPDELRASSVKVIKNSGKWIPAKNNGVVVESYSKQPINYKLSSY